MATTNKEDRFASSGAEVGIAEHPPLGAPDVEQAGGAAASAETFHQEEHMNDNVVVVDLGADETSAPCKTVEPRRNMEIDVGYGSSSFVEIDLERVEDEPEVGTGRTKAVDDGSAVLTTRAVLKDLAVWLLLGLVVAAILIAIQALASGHTVSHVIHNDPALLVAPLLILLLVGLMGSVYKQRKASHSSSGSDTESTHNSASSGPPDSVSTGHSID